MTDARATTANRLGALALVISHDIVDAIHNAANRHSSDAAALVVIDTWPGISVGKLAEVLSRSPSGAVRLIDRLDRDGLVERATMDDGRSVGLRNTRDGSAAMLELLRARRSILDEMTADLDSSDLETLDRIVSTMLGRASTSITRASAI